LSRRHEAPDGMAHDGGADTTSDTTQRATPRNIGQPPEKKTAYRSGFCNTQQHPETRVSGLWL
jgi:hypothetical protein